MTKRIPLTRGLYATVDDADYVIAVSLHKWRAQRGRRTWYAVADLPGVDGGKIYLHRLLLGLRGRTPCDHRDGNGLNCRRSNLRKATPRRNAINRAPFGETGFKGVTRERDKFRVRAGRGGKFNLGLFVCPKKAARAYDAHARQRYGEFARLNFPRPA